MKRRKSYTYISWGLIAYCVLMLGIAYLTRVNDSWVLYGLLPSFIPSLAALYITLSARQDSKDYEERHEAYMQTIVSDTDGLKEKIDALIGIDDISI